MIRWGLEASRNTKVLNKGGMRRILTKVNLRRILTRGGVMKKSMLIILISLSKPVTA
ncbi:MAG: hypothetical protein K0S04_657 [Herbinix sp.]|jgi:hypothetical protein|nr:hypothetical protein [Herbinix sp.]